MTLHSSFKHTSFRFLASTILFALLGSGLFALPAQAQDEEPEPQRYEDVTWNEVVLYDFKAGKGDRAMEIVGDMFFPASKKAGMPAPRVIELQTGPWDVMMIWTMRDGPSQMAWEMSPEEAKFQKAFRGMHEKDKAQKIWDEFGNTIARVTSFVGFSGRHGAPITAEMAQ